MKRVATLAAGIVAAISFNVSAAQSFTLSSSDISANKPLTENQIFQGFGCSGANISPQLSWRMSSGWGKTPSLPVSQGTFRSELLLLSPELLAAFKTHYIQDYPPARHVSLCAPMSQGLKFMWGNLLHAVRDDLPVKLQEHQAMGLLLALHQDGLAGPLLIERRYNLTEQVRQIIMMSPAKLWTAQEIAQHLSLGASTLRRRLQQESRSYRQIVEEVRMSFALAQLQTTTLPIGEIASRCGYLYSSRFTARFRQHYGCLPKNVR